MRHVLRTGLRSTTPVVLAAAVLVSAAFAACTGLPEIVIHDGAPDAGASDADSLADATLIEDAGETKPTLHFDPPVVEVELDGEKPKSATFVLRAQYAGGSVVDVAPESLEFDRPDLGAVDPGPPVVVTASGEYAGTGKLHAIFDGVEATAELRVQVRRRDVTPGVDAAAVAALDATTEADPLVGELRYPYDGTVFPLGLASPLLMWAAPNANDVYRVRYEQASYTYDGYFSVAAPARVRVDQTVWDRLTASNAGDPLKVTLTRWDAVQKKAYVSASQSWTIAPASLRGAIYYWTTSGGGHMSRIQPGKGAHPAVLYGGKCMGCHAVSADGSTLVATVKDQPALDDGKPSHAWVSFDLPSAKVKTYSTYWGGNLALNRDGKYVVFGNRKLRLGDTKTGQYVPNSGLETLPLEPGMDGLMMPAFSPDGKRLVAVMGAGTNYHNLQGGRLVLVDFDETTAKFSNFTPLASAAAFPPYARAIAYPSVAPDSQHIGFHVGNYPTGCDMQGCSEQSQQTGTLWLQHASGTPPVRLTRLSESSTNTTDWDVSFEPTFNPVERGGYFWVVFTSMRDWGNMITGTPDNSKKRLWVAAIDPKAPAGVDPSRPAFFLEGQEESTVNMRGFWAIAPCTASNEKKGCSAGFECCSGFCIDAQCVDPNTFACKGVEEACEKDEDCCNADFVECVNGACLPNVAR